MYCDYHNFPRQPVSSEKLETRGRNNIISHCITRIYPKLGKNVCAICWSFCACPSFVDQLDKYWLPNIAPSSQPRYSHAENCYYNKILEDYKDWIIMELFDNDTPQLILTKFMH